MAKTLLQAVNEILKRTGVVAGDAGALTTLTDSARQVAIDQAVQIVNEGIDELYTTCEMSFASEQAQSTVTLVAGTRTYGLPSDFLQIRPVPIGGAAAWAIDRSNSQYLTEFPGGYNAILGLDLEQDDTGIPHYVAVSPVNSQLYLDRTPTSAEAGRVYTFQYDKTLELDSAADTVPFNDAVFRAMVPAWVQLFKREHRNEFDTELYKLSMGRAGRLLTQRQMRSNYNPR